MAYYRSNKHKTKKGLPPIMSTALLTFIQFETEIKNSTGVNPEQLTDPNQAAEPNHY